MKCLQCGTDNPEHFSFCSQCGQPLAAPLPPAKPASSKILWVVLGLGLLFIVLVALGGTGFWIYKTWKDKGKEAYSQQEGRGEEAEEESSTGGGLRRSGGSQRISDAQYYEDRRQWDQAMAEYRAALQEDPNDYEAHFGLGNCYRKKHDLKAAMSEYQQAVRLNPQYVPARRALGRLYARQGDLDAAVEQLEAAQKADPKDPQVARELSSYRKRRAQKRG